MSSHLSGRTFQSRGSTMAIACGTAIAALVGGMYYMGRDVKLNEGQQSAYAPQGQGLSNTDRGMTSADVSSTVTSGTPPKEDCQREAVSNAR